MKKEILRLTQGSTIIHLYGKDLEKLTINVLSIEIQTTISHLLKSLIQKKYISN